MNANLVQEQRASKLISRTGISVFAGNSNHTLGM